MVNAGIIYLSIRRQFRVRRAYSVALHLEDPPLHLAEVFSAIQGHECLESGYRPAHRDFLLVPIE